MFLTQAVKAASKSQDLKQYTHQQQMKLNLVASTALFATAAAWNYAGPYEKVSNAATIVLEPLPKA
jgi:hypothetical protein